MDQGRLWAGLLLGFTASVAAAPPPIAAFAQLPQMRDVSISPDGRYLAYISAIENRPVVKTVDLQSQNQARVVMGNDKRDEFAISWCAWGNNTRLLCGYQGVARDSGVSWGVTRLVSVNADASEVKVLVQRSRAGSAQFQDRILDWTPDQPNSVLIQVNEGNEGNEGNEQFPSIFELDIYSGRLKLKERERSPIRSFTTDRRGVARLGWGHEGEDLYYFARLEGDKDWRRLARFKAFSRLDFLTPVAMVPDSNQAYAIGSHKGRDAVWLIDLSDQAEPQVIAHHPRVDISGPLFTADGQLLGIQYETDRPAIYYLDGRAERIVHAVDKLLPDAFNTIGDHSLDEKVYIIHSSSDVDAGSYYLFDIRDGSGKLRPLGGAYPQLDPRLLGRMQAIEYPARDGTLIPGYLTMPPGLPNQNLPLIVMPHGGPIARDSWTFDFLRAFLVSRGYAVLQMNFRGSNGYGTAWFADAHQDWGGLTYSDIVDGARWALKQGIADPQRLGIVGWSFGGYAALLGATRDSELFRCAISVAGISDLQELKWQQRNFTNARIAALQIGEQGAKLREDSPRRHAADVRIPLLLVHGTHDVNVEFRQSALMASALKSAGKPFDFIEIEGGDHQLWRESERRQLLEGIDVFLAQNLPLSDGLPTRRLPTP